MTVRRADSERLMQQLEGMIWRFKTGGQWRKVPKEFGAWPTVLNRFGSGLTLASSKPCWRT